MHVILASLCPDTHEALSVTNRLIDRNTEAAKCKVRTSSEHHGILLQLVFKSVRPQGAKETLRCPAHDVSIFSKLPGPHQGCISRAHCVVVIFAVCLSQ